MAENNLSLKEAFTLYTQKMKEYIAENSGGGVAPMSTTVVLSASEWTDNSQTVSVDGVTIDGTIIVSPAPNSHSEYANSGVMCTEQQEGSLVFTCDTIPTNDLTVNLLIYV